MRKSRVPPPPVPGELWIELYRTAAEFQRLAPWRWMDDSHIFGLNDRHGVRLASVIGNLGEVLGLAVYLGSAGINYLMRLLRREILPEDPDITGMQNSVLLDFVRRGSLRSEDRELQREISFQPAPGSPRLFPQFYTYQPGYAPWFLDAGEAQMMVDTLRRAICFAGLVRNEPGAFALKSHQKIPFFPAGEAQPESLAAFTWHQLIPEPPPVDPPVAWAKGRLAGLGALPQRRKCIWEVDAFISQMLIDEPPRPYYAKVGLATDAQDGRIYGFHASEVQDTLADTAALTLEKCLADHGFRPGTIRVGSPSMAMALLTLCTSLRIKVVECARLPAILAARASLEAFDAGEG